MAGEAGEWPKTTESCKGKQNKARSNAAVLSKPEKLWFSPRNPSRLALPVLVCQVPRGSSNGDFAVCEPSKKGFVRL